MSRILSALALIAGTLSGLSVAAPAHAAAVSVTIHASRTTLLEGDSTVISGKAVNASAGSMVELQHRSDGAWVEVKSRKIATNGTYTFTVTPKRGWQFYRVVKPRQLGQASAASPRLTLRVQWVPSVTFATEPTIADGAQWAVIHGSVADSPEVPWSYLHVQVRQGDGTWRTADTDFFWTDDARTVFVGTAELADGAVYRLSLDATDLTRAVHSQPATFHHQPYTMSVNSGLHLARLDDRTGAATIDIDLEAGEELTLVGSEGTWILHLIDPTGNEVGQVSDTRRFGRFPVAVSGGYRIVVDNFNYATGNSMDVWASTPLVQEVDLGVEPPLVSLLPRQELDLRFTVQADHAVVVDRNAYDAWTTDDSVIVDGTRALVTPLISSQRNGSHTGPQPPVYYSSSNATLIYRYRPDSASGSSPYRPTVFDAPIQDVTVDGPAVPSNPVPQDAVALFRYVAPAGGPPTLSTDTGPVEGYGPLAGWGGASAILIGPHANTGSVQLLSPLEFDYNLDDPELTVDTTPWFARELILHVPLNAGDVVSGTGTVWPEYSGSLRAPSGELIQRVGNYTSAYIVPADGTYTYHAISRNEIARIGVARDAEVTFPMDTPTRFVVDAPDHAAYAWCSAPPGTTVSVEALSADAALGDDWTVGISDPPRAATGIHSARLTTTYTVGASGRYLVLLDVTADRTGAVTLQQHVASAP